MAIRGKKREKAHKYVEELEGIIKKKFPEAQFRLGRVPETRGICLWVYSTSEDADIWNLVSERQSEMYFKDGVDIYVIPVSLKRLEDEEG